MLHQAFVQVMRELENTHGLRFLSPMSTNLLPVDADDAEPARGFTHHEFIMSTTEDFKAKILKYQKRPILVSKSCILYNSAGVATKEPGWFLYWRHETSSLYGVYCMSTCDPTPDVK